MKYNFNKLLTAALLCTLAACGSAQQQKQYRWEAVPMDAAWDVSGTEASKTAEIIARYKPEVDKLTAPIGKTEMELRKYPPESPLSNLAADIIRERAEKYAGVRIDMALTNFGGLRAAIPAGDISMNDVLSVFPFDNYIVILDLKGKYIREQMESFAKREKVEALSGVRLKIEDKEVEELLIGGKPLDDEKIYKVATIDFLLTGGDSVFSLKKASRVVETGIVLREAVADYIRERTARGETLRPKEDGRVVLVREEEPSGK